MSRIVEGLLRARLRTQLYVLLALAVMLTLGASIVGWVSFSQVAEAQRLVNLGSVPGMAGAFAVAQQAANLAAAAPRLTVTESGEALAEVVQEIAQERALFLDMVGALVGSGAQGLDAQRVRSRGREMITNLERIEASSRDRFDVIRRREPLFGMLADAETKLTSRLVTAIDDQYFFVMTGYRSLDAGPLSLGQHFTQEQLEHYRRLVELREAAAVGAQVMATALNVTDEAQLEPLRERFEATEGLIRRNLAGLGAAPVADEVAPLFDDLLALSEGATSIFDVRFEELVLEQYQRGLLIGNRTIATSLVGEVENLIINANVGVIEAAQASDNAIATGRGLLLALSVISVAGAVLMAWGYVGRMLLRRLEKLSTRMRNMAAGDLEGQVEIEGSDEVADMATSLDVFRKHALEVQRLNLVEKLADELQGKNFELESVLEELKAAQGQIVMREKLAALGELTAGVAHEIKNPLNFVKNFSEVSQELLEELDEVLPQSNETVTADDREEVDELIGDVVENLRLIQQHSERANRIVHDMLRMGRDSGDRYEVDINLLVKENATLAYHSMRATRDDFQVEIKHEFDPGMGVLEVIPQDLGRVVLNLVNNACHATDDRRRNGGDPRYEPTLTLATSRANGRAEIRVRDNGNGMPSEVVEKIFNPFFTTKPTNEGTGLGLSISNDIVVGHGGEIRVQSQPGVGTEMVIDLPTAPHVLE